MLIEVLRYPLINQANFRNLVHFEGLEHLEEAYAEARRHHVYGPLRKLGNAGGQYGPSGYPILSITRKQNDGDADRFINEYRQMVGQPCHLQPWKEQHAFPIGRI